MKVSSKKILGTTALFASAALVLAGCSSPSDNGGGTTTPTESTPTETGAPAPSGEGLKIAALLPMTGSLGFLMPPVEAGIHVALDEINAAGGVLGSEVELTQVFDESDSNNRAIIEQSVTEIIASGASFVLGAMSSGSTLHVVDQITGAGIMMGSPSNTAVALDGYDPFYFRTAPPDSVQGAALANQIVSDGMQDVAFLTFSDDYGLGLRDKIQEDLEAAGVNITYGAQGAGHEFPLDEQNFASHVTAAIQSGAEAIAIVTFDQINQILPELLVQGFDAANIYLVDGNANSFGLDDDGNSVVDLGSVVGMQGSIPGAQADAEFMTLLEDKYTELNNQTLASYTYGPEAYDLVMLTALAAAKGGAADAATIRDNVHAVSGATGGTECSTFVECHDLIEAGEDIQFMGKSGIGVLDGGDPSSAWIGIYEYNEENVPVFREAVYGEVVK